MEWALMKIREDGKKGYTWEPKVKDIEEEKSDLHYRALKRTFSWTAEEAGVGQNQGDCSLFLKIYLF